MFSLHEIDQVFRSAKPRQMEIINEIRGLVSEIAPDAVERIHNKGTSYYHAGQGGPVTAGICQVILQSDHIRLAFIHGAFLSDPHNLLQGNPNYKKYVPIYSFDDAPWDALRELITESSKFDPYTLNAINE